MRKFKREIMAYSDYLDGVIPRMDLIKRGGGIREGACVLVKCYHLIQKSSVI